MLLFVLLFLFAGAFDTEAGVMGMKVVLAGAAVYVLLRLGLIFEKINRWDVRVVLLFAVGSFIGVGLLAWLAVVAGVLR